MPQPTPLRQAFFVSAFTISTDVYPPVSHRVRCPDWLEQTNVPALVDVTDPPKSATVNPKATDKRKGAASMSSCSPAGQGWTILRVT